MTTTDEARALTLDDLCDDIRDSIYADDRQTRAQLDRGLAALGQLRAMADDAYAALASRDRDLAAAREERDVYKADLAALGAAPDDVGSPIRLLREAREEGERWRGERDAYRAALVAHGAGVGPDGDYCIYCDWPLNRPWPDDSPTDGAPPFHRPTCVLA